MSNHMTDISVHDIAPEERRRLEAMLGRPLGDHERVMLMAYTPGIEPDADR